MKKFLISLLIMLQPLFAITINNGILSSNVGYLAVNVGSAGETRDVTITAKVGDSNTTTEIVFDYFTYVQVGTNAFRLSSTTVNNVYNNGDNSVISEGEFTGSNGNTIAWKCISTIEPNSKIYRNVFIFNTQDTNESLGKIKLYQYLDEDVFTTSNIFFTRGDYCHGNLELFTINPSNSVGISHGGDYFTTTNSHFLGWAMDSYNQMKGRIRSGNQEVLRTGFLHRTGKYNHPIYGETYGIWDIVSVLAWEVDENNTNAQITTTLGGVVYSGELNEQRVDLTAGGLKINYLEDGNLNIHTRVGNAGLKDFDKNSSIVFILKDSNSTVKDKKEIVFTHLGKNSYINFDTNMTDISNTDTITVWVDEHNTIRELNERNNNLSLSLKSIIPYSNITPTSNKPTYTSNEVATLKALIKNLGKLDANLTAQLRIEDSEGRVVEAFDAQSLGMMVSQKEQNISNEWNTTDTLAGEYTLRGVLTDSKGTVVDEANTTFSIVHSGVAAMLDLRLDRAVYHTTDSVRMDNWVQSVSTNAMIDNGLVALEVRDSSQQVVYTQELNLGTLLPQSSRDVNDNYNYVRLEAGDYQVKATLIGDDNITYATDSQGFKVQENLNIGLKGSVEVAWRDAYVGVAQTCSYSVSNLGSATLENLSLSLRVIDMNSSMAVDEVNSSVTLDSAQTIEKLQTITTKEYIPREYSCGLYAYVESNWILLDHRLFSLNNIQPLAQEQNLSTVEDTALDIVLKGSDADADTLGYILVDMPLHGTLSGTVPNIRYMPELNYVGTDSFSFKVNDGLVDSSVAIIDIAISKDLVIPEATDDTQHLPTGTIVDVDVLSNDKIDKNDLNLSSMQLLDSEGELVTQIIVPHQGIWQVEAEGKVRFIPEAGYVGDPTAVAYSVDDYKGNTISAKIYLNYPPVAYDDNATTTKGTSVEIAVLANDKATSSALDAESVRLMEDNETSIEIVSAERGTWQVNTNKGTVDFSPEESFVGDAEAKYVVYELEGDRSNEATIRVKVLESNTTMPSPSPSATPKPTVTPTPMATVRPTPTVTPRPTATPTPRVTPTITPVPQVQETPNHTTTVNTQATYWEVNTTSTHSSSGDSKSLWFYMLLGMLLVGILFIRQEERRGH